MKPVYFLDNGIGIFNSPDGKNSGYSIPGDPIIVDKGNDKKRGWFTSKLVANIKIRGTKCPND